MEGSQIKEIKSEMCVDQVDQLMKMLAMCLKHVYMFLCPVMSFVV